MNRTAQFGRRKTDTFIGKCSRVWEWISKQQLDTKILGWVILCGTAWVVMWAAEFAWYSSRDSIGVAAIIAAVTAPYMALQAVVASFVFKSKQ